VRNRAEVMSAVAGSLFVFEKKKKGKKKKRKGGRSGSSVRVALRRMTGKRSGADCV